MRTETEPVLAAWRCGVTLRRVLTAVFPLIAVVSGLYYALPMASLVGERAFPLDAGYVPLVFARTLLEHGMYAFHPATGAASGAMAPLQVLMLVALQLVFSDGIIASFVLGIAAFAVTAGLTFRLGMLLFPDRQWMAAAAALLVALSPRLAGAAVSGLPAVLFAALLLASATAYFSRRSGLFFLFAGLALWVRPDALIFLAAAILHLLYNHIGVAAKNKPSAAAVPATAASADDASGGPSGEKAAARGATPAGTPVTGRQTGVGALVFLALAAGYVVFNSTLGGGWMPAPAASQLAYYTGSADVFFTDVARVLSYRWSAPLLVFALIALVVMLGDLVRRRPVPLFMSAATVLGFIFAYALIHPFMRTPHLLLPVMPFFFLVGLWGLLRTADLVARVLPVAAVRTAAVVIALLVPLIAAGLEVADWQHQRTVQYRSAEYLRDRHIAMGKWIAEHTPEDVLVATHVPGAIGWYGGRAVIDMKGAVSPAVIPTIGDLPGLIAMFDEAGVDYLATIRDEFEVVNVNPLVTSSPSEPGVAEVFRYVPTRTHIMSQRASAMNAQAAQLLQQEKYDAAVTMLKRSILADPLSSRTGTLLGIALLQASDTNAAIAALRQALALHPQYAPAMVPLGDVLVHQKNYTEGLRILERAVRLNPQSTVAKESLTAAQKAQRADSLGEQVTFSFELAAPPQQTR